MIKRRTPRNENHFTGGDDVSGQKSTVKRKHKRKKPHGASQSIDKKSKRKSGKTSSSKAKSSGRSRKDGDLPPILPVEVLAVDDDGDLICEPVSERHTPNDGRVIRITVPFQEANQQKPPPGRGDRLLVRVSGDGDHKTGQIVRRLNREVSRVLCIVEKHRADIVAEPVSRKIKETYSIAPSHLNDAKEGDIVWVSPEGRGNRRTGRIGRGKIVEIAGNLDEPGAYSLIALADHDIRIEFPEEVIAEATDTQLPTMEGREDLRDTGLLTIDPADAKDHDDAVSAVRDDDPNNKGGFRVWVAIADVSWFVRPGSALDEEALARGNSVYLPDRVVPMLPEELSNNLCSLRDAEDRPCIAVELVISADGHLRDHHFVRAMMRSAAKLSYEDAQSIIEGKDHPTPSINEGVRTLYDAYQCRLGERAKRAPLDLDLPERKIILGKDGLVKDVVARERFDAHKLIEEFMVLANVAAAITLERAKLPLIYRVHDTPDPERLDHARTYLATLDYSLVKTKAIRSGHFNQILKIAEKRDQKEMVSDVVLRTQQQAIYSTENLGHFGLNLARYAHFTSPIRRYADLTVHRALVKAGKLGEGAQTKSEAEQLDDIAQEISKLEREAMLAERETNDRYLSEFLSDQINNTFSARIRGVTRAGLFVMLDDSGADGFIPMRTLPGRGWFHDEDRNRIVDTKNGSFYQLGQGVSVQLREAAPVEGGLVFQMLSKPQIDKRERKAKPRARQSTKSKPRKKPKKPRH